MYGGVVTDGDRDISTNSIYLFQLSHYTIVSYRPVGAKYIHIEF